MRCLTDRSATQPPSQSNNGSQVGRRLCAPMANDNLPSQASNIGGPSNLRSLTWSQHKAWGREAQPPMGRASVRPCHLKLESHFLVQSRTSTGKRPATSPNGQFWVVVKHSPLAYGKHEIACSHWLQKATSLWLGATDASNDSEAESGHRQTRPSERRPITEQLKHPRLYTLSRSRPRSSISC